MRIANISSSYSNVQQLQKLQTTQTQQQERLVSGRRVNKLEDDPSTAANILRTRTDREAMIQMRDNASRADGIIETGVKTLEHLDTISDQASAVLQDSSLYGAAGADVVNGLITDAVNAANATYDGDYLFSGSATNVAPFSLDEATGLYVYNGSGDGNEFGVADGTAVSPFNNDAGNQEILNFLNSLITVRDTVEAGDTTAIDSSTGLMEQAQDAFLDSRTTLSMKQARIDVLQQRDAAKYSVLDLNETAATEADETESIMNLLNTQKAYEAALSSVSKIMNLSLLEYV